MKRLTAFVAFIALSPMVWVETISPVSAQVTQSSCSQLQSQLRSRGESYLQIFRQINKDRMSESKGIDIIVPYLDPRVSMTARRTRASLFTRDWNDPDEVNMVNELIDVRVDCQNFTGEVDSYQSWKKKNFSGKWVDVDGSSTNFWVYTNGQWYRTLKSSE